MGRRKDDEEMEDHEIAVDVTEASTALILFPRMAIARRRTEEDEDGFFMQGNLERAMLAGKSFSFAESGRDDLLRSPATRRTSCRGRRRGLQGCRTCTCEVRMRGMHVR